MAIATENVRTEVVTTTSKSPWTSTINWAQIVGAVATIAVAVGAPISEAQIASIAVTVQLAVAAYTVIRHTWFSPQVLTSSLTVK